VTDWPDRVRAALDREVTVDHEPPAVDVAPESWLDTVLAVRDVLGCRFFDWLSAVDEADHGFRVVCHLASHRPGSVDHLVVRTLLPRTDPMLESVAGVFAGAAWHERETHEMFGIDFTAGGEKLAMDPLLLPQEFEGHPLRKDFVLASRVAKPWPGAKEPGESEATPVRTRRRSRPLGVPAPDEWGPRDA
jgi:NADH-quinone oxidoreductase subunit C